MGRELNIVTNDDFNNYMKIAHKYAHQYIKYSKFDYDEAYSYFSMSLFKALRKFDRNSGNKPSTYIYKVLSNDAIRLIRDFRKNGARYEICDEEHMMDVTYDENGFNIVENKEFVDKVLKYMRENYSDKQCKTFILYLNGYNQSEISAIAKVSQSYASRIISIIKKDLSRRFKEERK